MIFLYPLYAILSLSFTLLTIILSPILALMADVDGNLPARLRWFQTFDATLNANGTGYWNRVKWLCRNPGYTFDMDVLGIRFVPSQWAVHYSTPTLFLASTSCGAFNLHYQGRWVQVKIGWKAENRYDPITGTFLSTNWAQFPKIPVVCTIMKG